MFAAAAAASLLLASAVRAQVTAVGPNGPTNPAAPSLGTPLNQTSYARLLSLNSYDDFCLYAPPVFVANTTTAADGTVTYQSAIGNTEGEEVAWCTKQRNNARLIPDGVITAAQIIKTPLYIQIKGYGDLTQLNIPYGDYGGELDPHGATGAGNPVGGNVTSNVSGSDVFYEEWMMFVSYSQFCLRICTAENGTYSAAKMCEHKIDTLGCDWVMPGLAPADSFSSCDGDCAYPPGVYPEAGGAYSTFAQYFTGQYTQNGQAIGYTVGDLVTPASPAMTPASSNCVTHSSPSNGNTLVQINPVANAGQYTVTDGVPVTPGSAASGASTASGASHSGSGSHTSGSAAGSGSGTRTNSGTSAGKTSSAGSSTGTGSSSAGVVQSAAERLPLLALSVAAALLIAGGLAIVA